MFTAIGYSQVKIGDRITEISPFSILELESTDKALLISRMNTQQRDAAFNQETPVGMIIFNTDLNSIQFYREKRDADGRLIEKEWRTVNSPNVILNNLPPEGAAIGSLYFNTDDSILFLWDGVIWNPINGANTSNNNQTLS
tara:strand:+ start:424 stop:846 length:423 start_codon:yes stop_codon:yes gene_type:complete